MHGGTGLGSVYAQLGRYQEAIAELQRGLAPCKRGTIERTWHREEAQKLLDEFKDAPRRHPDCAAWVSRLVSLP